MTARTPATGSTSRTEPKAPVSNRVLLVRALRKEGFGNLCKGEPRDYKRGGERVSQIFLTAVLLSLLIFAVNYLDLDFWPTVLGLIGSLLLFTILTLVTRLGPQFVYLTYVAASGASLVFLLLRGRTDLAFVTHLLPLGLLFAALWGYRVFSISASLPLFIPVAFIIVLAPLLTEDPWRLAAESGTRLAWLGAVSILPLLTLVIRQVLKTPTITALTEAANDIETKSGCSKEAAEILADRVSRDERPDDLNLFNTLQESYSQANLQARAAALGEEVGRRFKRNTLIRLLSVVAGVASSSYLLVYGLAWAAVPTSLAATWSMREATSTQIDLLIVSVDLPLRPYLDVAALFATVSVVGFLAFALTEEQHLKAVRNAVVGQRARMLLLLAIPFQDLSTKRQSDFNSATVTTKEPARLQNQNTPKRRVPRKRGRSNHER